MIYNPLDSFLNGCPFSRLNTQPPPNYILFSIFNLNLHFVAFFCAMYCNLLLKACTLFYFHCIINLIHFKYYYYWITMFKVRLFRNHNVISIGRCLVYRYTRTAEQGGRYCLFVYGIVSFASSLPSRLAG